MTARAHDSTPPLLYHGTRRGFRGRGGLLVPRASHGGPGTSAPTLCDQPDDAAEWVYLTTDLDLAWVYAWHAPGRGKPRVLVTAPLGEVESDVEHSSSMSAFRCRAATVAKVLTDPTVTEDAARSGWVLPRDTHAAASTTAPDAVATAALR